MSMTVMTAVITRLPQQMVAYPLVYLQVAAGLGALPAAGPPAAAQLATA
jgi:hypothetical protein